MAPGPIVTGSGSGLVVVRCRGVWGLHRVGVFGVGVFGGEGFGAQEYKCLSLVPGRLLVFIFEPVLGYVRI